MSDREFKVQDILGVKRDVKNKIEVLIMWDGYGFDEASWVGLDLVNCKSLLKPYEQSIDWLKGKLKCSQDLDDDGPLKQGLFQLEDILGVRLNAELKPKAVEYLVKWKGYKDSDNSWEPEKNVFCQQYTGFFDDAVEYLTDKYVAAKKSKKVSQSPKSQVTIASETTSVSKRGPKTKNIKNPVQSGPRDSAKKRLSPVVRGSPSHDSGTGGVSTLPIQANRGRSVKRFANGEMEDLSQSFSPRKTRRSVSQDDSQPEIHANGDGVQTAPTEGRRTKTGPKRVSKTK